MNKILRKLSVCLFAVCLLLTGCQTSAIDALDSLPKDLETIVDKLESKNNQPFEVVNNNIPYFKEDELTSEAFEVYSDLDELGRAQSAFANVGKETMPTEKRGNISGVKPTGWQISKYDMVDGKYLYNRCHLIGYQLTAENANEKNLITGTRYMNVDGMLPFENMIADYVKETGNHVLYRVTPVYEEDNLVANGVLMEAKSVEDNGEGVEFNVFVYNIQPQVTIDYRNGNNYLSSEKPNIISEQVIRGNSRSKIYHCPGQAAYEDMGHSNNLVEFKSEQEAIKAGYRKAKR